MLNLSRGALALVLFLSSFSIYAAEKIDINKAPMEELVKIIHIGEARALELISLRPFSSLDDLVRIKGIGETRIKEINEQGLAWISTGDEEKPLAPEEIKRPFLPAESPAAWQGRPFRLPVSLFIALFSGGLMLCLKRKLKA